MHVLRNSPWLFYSAKMDTSAGPCETNEVSDSRGRNSTPKSIYKTPEGEAEIKTLYAEALARFGRGYVVVPSSRTQGPLRVDRPFAPRQDLVADRSADRAQNETLFNRLTALCSCARIALRREAEAIVNCVARG